MAEILWRGDTSDGFMRGEGKSVIFQAKYDLEDQLKNIEFAGRTCYQSNNNAATLKSAEKFVRMILKRGHESVIEHSLITVRFSNVSRGFTRELVRHRVGIAVSQQSTRYVDESNLRFVVPPHKSLDDIGFYRNFNPKDANIKETIQILQNIYTNLRETGWLPQDARQFLPIGVCAQIVFSGNFRAWRHIFRMRTQKAAHWEIRYIMTDLLATLKDMIPVIFEDFEFAPEPDSNGYRYTLPKTP